MDNITHGLLGVTIGMLRRRDGGPEQDLPLSATDRAAAWAGFLAAEMPDIDTFFGRGPLDQFIYHRGITHGLVMAPVVALIATAVTKVIWRQARVGTVYLWSLAAVLIAHLTNDWFTGWGTRLLLPFSEARLGLDWIPIIDLLYTVPLAAAVWLAVRRPARRRQVATAVLAYLLVYAVGYRGITHTLVERAVRQQYAAAPVAQLRVAPQMLNPLTWQFTVDLGDRYEMGEAYPFEPIKAQQVVAKPRPDAVIQAVRQAPELQPFFAQFSFHQISYEQVPEGYRVALGDVRYAFAGRGMRYGVLLSPDLKVQQIGSGQW